MSWSPPEDYEAPPPAYEEDFDRKVSLAVETSLAIHQEAPAASRDDDEWETWDEATFQANAAAQTQNGNASSSSTQVPADRRTSQPPSGKQRPSWYDQAELDSTAQPNSSSANAASSTSRPLPLPSPRAQGSQVPPPPRPASFTLPPSNRHSFSPEPDEPDEPLPAFTPIDTLAQEQVTTLGWQPSSRPPSPLASPPTAAAGLPVAPPPMSAIPMPEPRNDSGNWALSPPSPNFSRQSMPPAPKSPPQRVGPRPVTTAYQTRPKEGTRIALPHVQFDPSVAYNNNRNSTLPPPPQINAKASSFYNSSVTATINRQNGLGLPQPSRNLPQRSAPAFQHLNTGPYDSSGYHSPKPVRAYPTANIPPPPPLPHANVQQYPQYPAQGHWQVQPQGGGYPGYYGQ